MVHLTIASHWEEGEHASWNCTGDRASVYHCVGRVSCETLRLMLRQLPASSVLSPRGNAPYHQVDVKWEFSSLSTSALVSHASLLPLRTQTTPEAPQPTPSALASQEHRSSLPTVWSFSAFSLGRERLKGQEEGGLRLRKKACCPLPGNLPAGYILSPVSRRGVAQP